MKTIENYISLPRDERRAHLRLTDECKEIGGTSKEFKGLLAYHLGTTIPSGREIFLCHACHNSKCSNVHHLYWGSPKDNAIDATEILGSIYHRTLVKLGKEGMRNTRGSSSGGKANKNKPKSEEHRAKIAASLRKK